MPPHCDSLDGPVVTAARQALETGDVGLVLPFVPGDGEDEVRAMFDRVQPARGMGEAAREVADRLFFETVVRVHRAGEGAPYTGLKPAGTPDPAVAAADRIIAGGDAKPLEELLVHSVRDGLHKHVANLKKERPPAADVAAGRRWVAAYVPFVHWAEGVYAAAAGSGAHGEKHAESSAAGHAEQHSDHGAPKAAAGGHAEHHADQPTAKAKAKTAESGQHDHR